MRIRFRFAKLGKVRFTSQRDVARMWERALRRAELPLAYTEGFSPRPRLSFGLALPTGCESEAEYLDVVVDDRRVGAALVVEELPARLGAQLPEGILVRDAAPAEAGDGSLQQLVTSCSWTLQVAGATRDAMEARVASFLAAPSVRVTRERKGRDVEDDVRAGVLSLAVVDPRSAEPGGPDPQGQCIEAELTTQPRGIRPEELVAALRATHAPADRGEGPRDGSTTAGNPVLDRACRTHQWIERDGVRAEPIEWARRKDAERAGYAMERAS